MRRLILLALLLCLGAPGPAQAGPAEDVLTDLRKVLRRGESAARVVVLRRAGRSAGLLSEAQRRSAAVQIRKRLDGERDDDVRRTMVHTLARLGTATAWVPVLLLWLEGRDPVTRDAARQALLWGGGDYLEVVERLLKEDEDPTFRARLLLLLGDRRRPDAVPTLLAALEEKHARVRSAAAESLEAITGQALGYDAAAWVTWWQANAATLLHPEPTDPLPHGETETVAADGPERIEEPPPHVTRALHPDFYGLPLTSKDIVFVVDVSGSVGSGGVGRAKKELIRAVEQLGSDVHVAALFFDEEVRMWKPEMQRATPAIKAELAFFLRGIRPGKRTDVFTPLNAGLQIVRRRVEALQAADEPIREAVTMIIVSDGKQTSARTPPHVVADKLSRLDPEHTVVHAIALGDDVSPLLLEIARRGGGHYIQAR